MLWFHCDIGLLLPGFGFGVTAAFVDIGSGGWPRMIAVGRERDHGDCVSIVFARM